MAKEYKDLVVGLDIGTAKIMAVVAEVMGNGELRIAGLGVAPSHGLKRGVVIGSTQTTDTFGKRLARVGDQVTCPKKGHGTTVIVTGDPTMIVDGAPVARHGDKCACGATLISSQVVSGRAA